MYVCLSSLRKTPVDTSQYELVQGHEIDLEYCEALEKELYELFDHWLKGIKEGYRGLEMGKRYGNAVNTMIDVTHFPREKVVFMVKYLKRLVKGQLQEYMDSVPGYERAVTPKDVHAVKMSLFVEKCFWNGMLSVIEL